MIVSIKKENFLFYGLAVLFIVFLYLAIATDQYFILALPFAVVLFYVGWLYRNIAFLLLLISLPFSTEYYFSATLATDFPDELMMLFVSGLYISRWFYQPSVISKKTISHPLLVLTALTIIWVLVTVFNSSHPLFSLKFLLAKTWYVGAFIVAPLILFKEKDLIRTAFLALVASMFVVVVLILLKHAGDGFRFADINNAVSPFFRNHVNYSAMLVCMIPLLLAFYSGTKSKDNKFLIAIAIIICSAALYFSFSRGAWVALLVGALAYILTKKGWLLKSYVIAMLAAFAVLFWLKQNDRYLKYAPDYQTTIFHKDFKEHLVATYKLKDVSTAERFYRWIAGVRMIKDNWLGGYGPNTFYYHYKGYAAPAYKTWVSDNKERSTVHNYFLLTAIEQGIPGLALLLILLGAMLWYAQHLYKRITDRFYKITAITIGVVITMIITLNFLSDLIETDKLGSLFFLAIGMLVITDINANNKKSEARVRE